MQTYLHIEPIYILQNLGPKRLQKERKKTTSLGMTLQDYCFKIEKLNLAC